MKTSTISNVGKSVASKLTNVHLQKLPSKYINEYNLTALDNYCKSQNASVIIANFDGLQVSDTMMTVYKGLTTKMMFFDFSKINNSNFAETIRNLYKSVESAIKEIDKRRI